MSLRTNLLAAVTGIALFGIANTANAQSYAHIDRLALRLQQQTAVMHSEVHAHFRATRDYVHLDRDVTQMERLARHIHDVAHRNGSVSHLRSDVRELDDLFHHVEEVIDRLARTRQIDPRTLRHFRGVMGNISDTLHHLRSDLANMRDHDYRHGYDPRPGGIVLPRLGLRIGW
jgi:hypothetical protein